MRRNRQAKLSKKAYLKTVEVMIAIVFAFTFLLYFLPKFAGVQNVEKSENVLKHLEHDNVFRDFVISNTGCINKTDNSSVISQIEEYLPDVYDYRFCINDRIYDLPPKKVLIDTVFIAGNLSDYSPSVVRLYYWIG
ncbi:MAG: hypothetical protein KKF44_09055 [Nanoarchaeota archaeon]|nr:hypothetical protein [Nanoarchaeota archaeon]